MTQEAYRKSNGGLVVKSVKSVEKLKYLHAFSIDYQTKSGQQATWEIVSRGSLERLKGEIFQGQVYSDGAVIFACNRERSHVVLLKEFRVSSGDYLYMLPAGLSEEGELAKNAAEREFYEETGLALEVVHVACPRYVSVGIINECVTVVYGYYTGEVSQKHLTDEEDIEVVFVDRVEAQKIMETKAVCLRTALLLQNFFGLSPF